MNFSEEEIEFAVQQASAFLSIEGMPLDENMKAELSAVLHHQITEKEYLDRIIGGK